MADDNKPTEDEKRRAFKDAIKEALREMEEENNKRRTEEGNKSTRSSIFDLFK